MQKVCYFCQKNIDDIDFKDTDLLRKYLSIQARITPARRSGNCKKHQRELSTAIKRARFMALIPYTTR